MKKLILSIVLAAMCFTLFACTPNSTSAPTEEDSLGRCLLEGYLENIPQEYYSISTSDQKTNLTPEAPVTPEMLSVMLANLSQDLGFNLNGYLKNQASFSDAETDTWYTEAVHWVYIFEMMGRDTLEIGTPMTKETLGKFLYQYLYQFYDYRDVPYNLEASFADAAELTSSKKEFAALEYLNLLVLDDENKYYPTKEATIQEACSMFQKLADFCKENISMKLLMKRGVSTDFRILQYCNPAKPSNQENLYNNADFYKELWEKGFDHIRVPVAFDAENPWTGQWPDHAYFDENGNLTPTEEYIEIIDTIIDYALDANLFVMLDVHGYEGKVYGEEATGERLETSMKNYISIWTYLADRYQDKSNKLIYELYNEPVMDADSLEEFMYKGVEIVRNIDEDRTVFVTYESASYHAMSGEHPEMIEEFKKDPNIWFTCHNYFPYEFTIENNRTHVDHYGQPVYYPFNEDMDFSLTNSIMAIAEDELKNGIDYWVGEWGAYDNVALEDRVAYCKRSAELYRKLGIAWCKWEISWGFAMYDPYEDVWNEEILAALFS